MPSRLFVLIALLSACLAGTANAYPVDATHSIEISYDFSSYQPFIHQFSYSFSGSDSTVATQGNEALVDAAFYLFTFYDEAGAVTFELIDTIGGGGPTNNHFNQFGGSGYPDSGRGSIVISALYGSTIQIDQLSIGFFDSNLNDFRNFDVTADIVPLSAPPVPEIETWAMLLIGFMTLSVIGIRRRHRLDPEIDLLVADVHRTRIGGPHAVV